ncbi:ABC transporter substrate-binding protein [Pelagibacterium luteolum]|uniref:Iron(III) transport system substrate-binding protein n=1 Tax=Pelagibacterium luteolum TaxID=440168 RepID=A0A1G7XXB9_9HYPH|nr:ABC transporter substrate-binding protein [Pelagibacterium luteolum]SDG88797.1 iron(III) transport system substrate-binding protein [Pelagibacterium luteolum]
MTTTIKTNVTRPIAGALFVVLVGGISLPASAQDNFDLDALIEAARGEAPITIYDSTGKIVDMAEAFSAHYGIEVTGVKVSATAQFEQITREAQAGNVQGDVALITDTPAAVAQLMPQGYVESWLPPDMEDKIPSQFQSPLAITTNANVFAYNTEAHETCPVTNIWQLTDPEWEGRFAMVDPLTKGTYSDWFNQMETYADDQVAQAYEDHYGVSLETDQPSATAAWVVALAESAPLITDGDDAVSEAVGVRGQDNPFVGLMSSAKFRDNDDLGYALGLCTELRPWVGWSYTKLGLIASGTDSPNLARLFIHYTLTEEGIMPQMVDGKIPTNTDISMPADEPSGIMDVADRVFGYDAATALEDWDARQDWQDLWRVNFSR